MISGQRKLMEMLRKLIAESRVPARRGSRVSGFLMESTELLEQRKVLSGIATVPLPPGFESVAATAGQPAETKIPTNTAPVFPDVTGTWDITLVGVFDGDPIGPFNGTVSIEQKNGKVKGVVQIPGLPDFNLKGKLDSDNVLVFSGKTRFPYEFNPDRFFRIRLDIDLTYAADLNSFNGTFHRSIFGHDIDGTVTGNRNPT